MGFAACGIPVKSSQTISTGGSTSPGRPQTGEAGMLNARPPKTVFSRTCVNIEANQLDPSGCFELCWLWPTAGTSPVQAHPSGELRAAWERLAA